jgi:hypothetical protein
MPKELNAIRMKPEDRQRPHDVQAQQRRRRRRGLEGGGVGEQSPALVSLYFLSCLASKDLSSQGMIRRHAMLSASVVLLLRLLSAARRQEPPVWRRPGKACTGYQP